MSIRKNLQDVQARIKKAAEKSGRSESDVQLLGVTKYASDREVQELVCLGVTQLGESRIQDAKKRLQLFPNVKWHFIGRLQTNKVRYCEHFSLIHSLDRWNLAEVLQRRASQWGRVQDVLIQVN